MKEVKVSLTNSIFVIFFLLVQLTNGQTKAENTSTNITSIQENTLYFIGGFFSQLTKNDLEFSKKYNIKYYDFGCIPPNNISEFETKNILIFNLLNKRHGTAWQKEINPILLGFDKFIKSTVK